MIRTARNLIYVDNHPRAHPGTANPWVRSQGWQFVIATCCKLVWFFRKVRGTRRKQRKCACKTACEGVYVEERERGTSVKVLEQWLRLSCNIRWVITRIKSSFFLYLLFFFNLAMHLVEAMKSRWWTTKKVVSSICHTFCRLSCDIWVYSWGSWILVSSIQLKFF